jgi:hypothetical protein
MMTELKIERIALRPPTLSERLRQDGGVASWLVEAAKQLEARITELEAELKGTVSAGLELARQRDALKVNNAGMERAIKELEALEALEALAKRKTPNAKFSGERSDSAGMQGSGSVHEKGGLL